MKMILLLKMKQVIFYYFEINLFIIWKLIFDFKYFDIEKSLSLTKFISREKKNKNHRKLFRNKKIFLLFPRKNLISSFLFLYFYIYSNYQLHFFKITRHLFLTGYFTFHYGKCFLVKNCEIFSFKSPPFSLRFNSSIESNWIAP